MRDADFLNWLANRLVGPYAEHPDTDFVLKTRQIALRLKIVHPEWETPLGGWFFEKSWVDAQTP